ncbi:MAG: hypothetical protein ACREAM_21325, partial [Blastocatellia bacterium]
MPGSEVNFAVGISTLAPYQLVYKAAKREYGKNGNNGTNGRIWNEAFRLFRYFRLFRILSLLSQPCHSDKSARAICA